MTKHWWQQMALMHAKRTGLRTRYELAMWLGMLERAV